MKSRRHVREEKYWKWSGKEEWKRRNVRRRGGRVGKTTEYREGGRRAREEL